MEYSDWLSESSSCHSADRKGGQVRIVPEQRDPARQGHAEQLGAHPQVQLASTARQQERRAQQAENCLLRFSKISILLYRKKPV